MTETKSRFRLLLPCIITAVLFAAGGFAIYRLLGHVQLSDVMEIIRATPKTTIALAILFTFGGYVALIGYDWSALRYIGRKLPFPVVATGAFLGYGIGNTVGAGPVTGGAVRYRIYSALGLTALDIAGVSTFSALAFGAGSLVVGLAALAWHPYALGSLLSWSPATIRWGALFLIAVSLAGISYLVTRKGEFTVRGVTLTAPAPKLMAGQFVFTAAETLLSATVLYLLLPADGINFPTFVALFAVAVMAGVASHIPGGIGVFEAIIIAGLPDDVPVDEIAAGLLLYRLIYYLLPFSLALMLMGAGELRIFHGRFRAKLAPIQRAISALMPLAMAAMTFALGAMMMTISLIPPTDAWTAELDEMLPPELVEGGALLTSALGACLLVIAHGLMRRVEGAWWLALFALIAGAIASIAKGIDYQRAAILIMAALILLPSRREFYRATRLTKNVLSLRWTLLILCLAGTLLAMLLFAHKATPYSNDLWWQFASDKGAPRALRAALVGLLVLIVLLLIYALRPGRMDEVLPAADDLDHIADIIRRQGRPEACIALTGDKAMLMSETGNSFLMYRAQGRSWIALHDPIGKASELSALAWEFHDAAYAANARPVFYSVSGASAHTWIDMGLILHKLGEEAVVDLADFSLEGSSRKRLRTTYNRALRDGLTFEMATPPHSDDLLSDLQAISDRWLKSKAGAEKSFSVGAFDPAYLNRTPIALIRHDGRIVAFANLWVTDLKKRAAIDLMRHLDDTPSGVMEFLFTSLLLHFKEDGHAEFSLGNAPLSGLEARRGARLSTHLGAFIYRHGRQFYNFEGLRSFKSKFDPRWEPVYVAVPPRVNLVAVARDLVEVISGTKDATAKIRPSQTAHQVRD